MESKISHSKGTFVSYMHGLNSDRSTKYITTLAYSGRRERRKTSTGKGNIVFLKNLEDFYKSNEEFLKASNSYLEIVHFLNYLDLEKTEGFALLVIPTIEFRLKSTKKLYETYGLPILEKTIQKLNLLKEANTKIYDTAKKFIEAHKTEGAIERGFIVVSDLSVENYSLNFNFRIDLISDEDEIKGNIEDLDIVVFGETVGEVVENVKEYIIDLYEELNITDDKLLSRDLAVQKAILKDALTKD